MIKRCWYCLKELGVAHYCATDIKGVYCDAVCLEAQRNKVRFAIPSQDWNCEQCNRPFVGAAYIYRLPDGTGAYCSAVCRDVAQGKCLWRKQPLPAPPVIQKDESGRCGDCRHWVGPLPGGEMATCHVLTFSASPYIRNHCDVDSFYNKVVRTNKDFCCLEFQAKDG